MSTIKRGIFDFRSKDDKKRDYEIYSKQIFPYGESQKERVSEILSEMFPKLKQHYLRMYYILIKEKMTDEEPVDFDTAVDMTKKRSLIRATPELKAGVHALINADLAIDEKLEYPSTEELLTIAHTIISAD